MKSTIYVWVGLSVFVAAQMGCEVTSEKIATWKVSDKGAPKIRAALRDTRQKTGIRLEAAEALGEMGLFAPLAEDLRSVAAQDRQQILEELTKRVITRMKGSNPKGSTRPQLQAKDTVFAIRDLVEGGLRRTLDEELVRWVVGDWTARSGGEHSSEKIVKTIGAAAGPLLAEALTAGPAQAVTLATLLREVGDQGARDAGADRLIALAKKESPARMETFHALGKVGSSKAIGYLAEVATKGEPQHRVWALRAMALYPKPTLVPAVKAIAADATLTDDRALIRDEAFTVLEKIEDPQSLDALLEFFASKDDKVRYRAAEAVIAGFKAQGLRKLLEGLPLSYPYKKEDLTDFVENDIVELGAAAVPPMREALSSKSWIARLVAVRVLARLGTQGDLAALEKLSSDSTKIRGWEGGATVGSEAKAAAENLRKRK
jgi:HEAT repeat protein